jgi:hypothetical protein
LIWFKIKDETSLESDLRFVDETASEVEAPPTDKQA